MIVRQLQYDGIVDQNTIAITHRRVFALANRAFAHVPRAERLNQSSRLGALNFNLALRCHVPQ